MIRALALAALLLATGAGGPAGRFAYSTRAGDIWVVDADGSHRRQLTHSGGGFDFGPTWSPDGQRIAFQTTRGTRPPAGETNIFVVDVRTGRERQLTVPTRFRYGGSSPDWSPDGKLIAFASPHGLALVSPAGGPVRLLGFAGEGPVWSPDGTRLAYAAGHDLYVAARDGSHARRLTRDPGDEFPGAWSPAGTKLAYFRGANGAGHTWVIGADGSGARQVTNGPGTQFAAGWLGNGRLLVGISKPGRRTPSWYLVRANGSDPQPLPQLAGAIDAAWVSP